MDEEITAVREQHQFNIANLQKYLSDKLRDINSDTFIVKQYGKGQSNPTFLLQTSKRRYVLRKKPPGELLPGAHKVDREYRVQKALFETGFPVPEPLLFCADQSVIGTEFYVMEHVQGRIFRDIRLPGLSVAEQVALYVAAAEVLAKLHSLDLAALGLGDYGRGPGYCKRQVSTWTKQYRASSHRDVPAMDRLSDWLMNNLPTNDSEVTLVHGDFRLDNLVFHPTEARVLAVLDWELSTTGQPLADLAYFLMPFYWPSHFSILDSMGGLGGAEGVPSPTDLAAVYSRCRGIPPSLPQWNFFLALAMFKMAGIAQGIYARFLLGNASAADAHKFGQSVEPLAEAGLRITSAPPTSLAGREQLFQMTPKGRAVLHQVQQFMKQHVFPAQQVCAHQASPGSSRPCPVFPLQTRARAAGLWNLFLPAVSGLSQLDYAHIAEETGRCFFAPEVFNCQAPGWLCVIHFIGKACVLIQMRPLPSTACSTEPDVSSSDATNIRCSLRRAGDQYIIKPGCASACLRVCVSANTLFSFRHKQHSMVLVPLDTAGVELVRPLTVFGEDDAIHGGHFEINFNDVRVPVSSIVLGEGRGFEIAQARLGPGRLHHCMRAVGLAETALELMCQRAAQRSTFGKRLYQHEVIAHWIAECRIAIEQTRLLTLHAAHCLDVSGSKEARKQIAMIKVAAGRMSCRVVDCAIQVHGGAGLSADFPLAQMYAYVRTLRIADGPDEVHLSSIARMELKDQLSKLPAKL
uniref:Acyl-CoA dehydrogenase family, member 11 n=1 Tax=Paramormyrops kingsleyae TaxID=1676925 RepID=A0A3B3TDC9_9TELE